MHNRKFVFSAIDMVMVRFSNILKVNQVQDIIEKIMISSNFVDGAPFKWVGLTYRFGIKNKLNPQYYRIDKKDGELPLAIEFDSHILIWADDFCSELFVEIFIIGALDALIDVGKKYKLQMDLIVQEKAKRGDVPNTIEDCEAWVKAHS